MNILEKIKAKKTYLKKSNMCSGDEFLITITYNNKKASFHYHDNYMNKGVKEDFLVALYNDALAYYEHENDFNGFMFEYGYEEPSKAKKVYDACKRQNDRLTKLFDEDELSQLVVELEGWF